MAASFQPNPCKHLRYPMETAANSTAALDDERAGLARALQMELEPLVKILARLERQPEPDEVQLSAVDQRLATIHDKLREASVAIQDEPGPQILVASTCFASWPITFGEVIAQLQVTTDKLRQERQKLRGIDWSSWRRLTCELEICWQIFGQVIPGKKQSDKCTAVSTESALAETSPRSTGRAIGEEAAGEEEEQLPPNCRKVLLYMLKKKVFANSPMTQDKIAIGAGIGETKKTYRTLRDRVYIKTKRGGGTHLTKAGAAEARNLKEAEDIRCQTDNAGDMLPKT